MRNIRWWAVAATIAAWFGVLASGASAAPPTGHGVLHSPNGAYRGHSAGYWLAQWWAPVLSMPADDSNPAISGGCVLKDKVALHYGGDCTLPPGTAIFEMLFSTECSNREPAPFHAENAKEAEACGRANIGVATGLDLRVDNGPTLHLLDDRFATAMPFTTVDWPEDNIYGLPGGGKISYGGYGFVALIDPLSRGTHTIDFTPSGEGAPPPTHSVITIG
jgi:hypothetical protein